MALEPGAKGGGAGLPPGAQGPLGEVTDTGPLGRQTQGPVGSLSCEEKGQREEGRGQGWGLGSVTLGLGTGLGECPGERQEGLVLRGAGAEGGGCQEVVVHAGEGGPEEAGHVCQ